MYLRNIQLGLSQSEVFLWIDDKLKDNVKDSNDKAIYHRRCQNPKIEAQDVQLIQKEISMPAKSYI